MTCFLAEAHRRSGCWGSPAGDRAVGWSQAQLDPPPLGEHRGLEPLEEQPLSSPCCCGVMREGTFDGQGGSICTSPHCMALATPSACRRSSSWPLMTPGRTSSDDRWPRSRTRRNRTGPVWYSEHPLPTTGRLSPSSPMNASGCCPRNLPGVMQAFEHLLGSCRRTCPSSCATGRIRTPGQARPDASADRFNGLQRPCVWWTAAVSRPRAGAPHLSRGLPVHPGAEPNTGRFMNSDFAVFGCEHLPNDLVELPGPGLPPKGDKPSVDRQPSPAAFAPVTPRPPSIFAGRETHGRNRPLASAAMVTTETAKRAHLQRGRRLPGRRCPSRGHRLLPPVQCAHAGRLAGWAANVVALFVSMDLRVRGQPSGRSLTGEIKSLFRVQRLCGHPTCWLWCSSRRWWSLQRLPGSRTGSG